MKIKKPSIYYIILFFLMILDLEFLNLVDIARFNIFGLYYSDIIFIICILVVVAELIRCGLRINKNASLVIVFSFLTIACFSAKSAQLSYNQSFLAGIAAQREWLSWIVIIIPIFRWLKQKKITREGIQTCIRYVSRCYVLICIVQYFLYNYVTFTYVMTNSRYGSVRLYFNTAYFSFAICIILDELFNKKITRRQKTLDLIEIVAYFFVVAFITKGRMGTIALVASMAISFSLRKNISLGKKISIIICVIIGVVIFTYTTMGQDVLNTITGVSSKTDTLSVRDAAKAYYIGKTMSSSRTLFFGYGVPNIHSKAAMAITNPLWKDMGDARFYLSDVGIVGIFFNYGVFGILLLIGLTIFMLIKFFSIYRKQGKTQYLQYLILDIITWASLTPTLFNTSILGIILLTAAFVEENCKISTNMDICL
jgi:hypothetical protein